MLLLFLISLLFGETKDLHFQERDSILYQAKKLSLKIKEKVNEPNQTSVWLFIKPEKFETLSLQVKTFKEIGFDGVDIGSLLQNPPVRLDIDSKWGTKKAFSTLCSTLKKEELSLIGSIPIGCTGPGADFKLALHHYKDYPSLYELISIDEALWPLLPEVKERMSLPLNQDTIALLANEGILKKSLEPNTYYSVTKEISCIDGKIRRYIYLHLEENPLLNFESPLFTAQRLLAGELLFLKGKQDYVRFTGMQNKNLISEELTLLAHTLGQKTIGECSTFKKMKTDLCDDLISRTALVHSFLTQDASFLRLITLHQTSNTFVHRLEVWW